MEFGVSGELGILSRPDGSASYCLGGTEVVAAVYGPGEVKIKKEMVDRATIDVVYKPKIGLPGCKERNDESIISATITNILLVTLHPRTSINVILQEVQDAGNLLSCCINAVCMALMEAGLPMNYLVASVSCVLDAERKCILNPNLKQQKESKVAMTFCFDSVHHDIISCDTRGSFTKEEYVSCETSCKGACVTIFEFYRDTAAKKLTLI